MAPSASMLFLSYHQLHRPAEAPRKEAGAAAGGLRLSVSSLFSPGVFGRRGEAVRAEEGKSSVRERDAGEEVTSTSSATAAAAARELDEKFEEAVRLSCWSS